MYTIGQVSEMFGLPVSTLRYYDKEGRFMDWCVEGSSTYPQRLELFETQRAAVEAEMERLERVLDMLRFKCWYYTEAIRDGNEDRLSKMQPENMPADVREAYLRAHGE